MHEKNRLQVLLDISLILPLTEAPPSHARAGIKRLAVEVKGDQLFVPAPQKWQEVLNVLTESGYNWRVSWESLRISLKNGIVWKPLLHSSSQPSLRPWCCSSLASGGKSFVRGQRKIQAPTHRDDCPGEISSCRHFKRFEDCLVAGGSRFRVSFPLATESTAWWKRGAPRAIVPDLALTGVEHVRYRECQKRYRRKE